MRWTILRSRRSLALVLVVAVGCATSTPVGVRRVDAKQVQRQLSGSALTTDRPSTQTRALLTRLDLRDRARRDPDGTLAVLHAGLEPTGDEDRLFALAELSFLDARRTGRRDRALAAAVYAYAFLFPGASGPAPDAFDPRVQVARGLYNRGLAMGLRSDDGREVELEGRGFALPFGDLVFTRNPADLTWAGWRLGRFANAADLEVRGLSNRYRNAGVGAPLAASLVGPAEGTPPPGHNRIPSRLKVPVTAFLRLSDPRAAIASGHVRGSLEVYAEDERTELEVDGRSVPLESERSSSLASMLEGSPIWDFGFAGFRLGDFLPSGQTERLIFLGPYLRGHIPLVLVHGTFSSPAAWAEMVNELENDPVISRRYQIWLFLYNTGNPIPYSGGLLVKSLEEAIAELDAERTDPALQHMVVVGHSQGGLLTKLTAVDSGDRFWSVISSRPLDELGLDPNTTQLLRQSLFYEPLPFVARVVFLATPHQGSYQADRSLARWVSRLVKMPVHITQLAVELATHGREGLYLQSLARPPTSLDNMSSSDRFLRILAELPIDPRIAANSIIAVRGAQGPPFEGGTDGVVRFESARLPGVESELVVDSGHSVQQTQAAIQELRRILLRHAQESGLFPQAPALSPAAAPESAARAPESRPADRRAPRRSSRSP